MSSLSETTAARCQSAITQKLSNMLGEEGVEILTDYVWHMVTRPKTTKEHVTEELREFLAHDTDEFVEWLIGTVGPIINEEVTMKQQAAQSEAAPVPMEEPSVPQQYEEMSSAPVPQREPPSHRQPPQQPSYRGGSPIFMDPQTGAQMALLPLAKLRKIKKRCAKFPNCPYGEECRYIHPSEQCVNWPHCNFGDECFYIHPNVPCRYGINCPNVACNYTHPPEWDRSKITTRINAYTGTFKNYTYSAEQ
ncbi:putative PWI domain protein [Gregarina niphandrodes]|uniref:PWI domain protein n=1 Tax=Gregarina niphandrodes TaxID=110365 RepID=A0A023BBH5_GRENI|nr:putative PWI domain protein [Gregarina niphandrodes]EZG79728.1 putative PWI domain protein [Gregarina niphandrodes]|eukprot:XP_011134384.1 putative PWI domain protein [Gregarina niphandrodes]